MLKNVLFGSKETTELKLTVFHGRDNHGKIDNDIVFFSSSETFSQDYGEVRKYEITVKNPFNTSNEEDINQLLLKVSLLEDTFDDSEYASYAELEESGLLYHDTWEIFEPHIETIKGLGYDGMVIYEGGIENYICFIQNQFRKL